MGRTEGGIPPFERFLEEHRAVVYRFLLAAAGPQEADDCFQETFLSALKAYPRLRHGDNLRGWVLAIATRKAIDAGRARSRRPVPVDEVWDAVRNLPPRQRVALVHRVVLDQTYAEMAAAMGGSVETARANVYQ